jgi:NADH-ubiquinone oxidoreductase chain 5
MYLALIILPILGSILSGFFGRKIGVKGAQTITCIGVLSATTLAIIAFLEVGFNGIPVSLNLARWIDTEWLNVWWAFNFDSLTVSMLIPVLIVSSLVHIYSIGYMSHDPHNQRFFSYLSLFTFMMIILVTADNFILMFVGWEGVGVCSYLLVSFWFTRIAANQSSLSAFLTNRVGDCFLTIGMFAILWSFGDVNYSTVFSLSPYFSENVIIIIGICLLIGAMAKSSQVGLHVWLPMAMEGPTPVSALIHAATMVTAGVYLLMRVSPIIEYSSILLLIILWIGAITTVFSSLVGLFQQDIKKVIAYSTMSQLGMMVIAVGLSSYNIALFHLVNHAFYKALLFLGAGAVIHAVADNQDFRKYGGLIRYLPLSYSVMLIASLSLVAFPFMTGFYSKDLIIESAFGKFNLSSIIIYFISSIGAMFTTLYSIKVLYITFLSNPNGPLVNYKDSNSKSAHEGDIFMSMPLIILSIFSIFFGYINKDIFIGLGSDFFSDNALFIHPHNEIMISTEFFVPIFFKLLPLFFTLSLTAVSILYTEFYQKSIIKFKYSLLGYNIFSFLNQRFSVELLYNKYLSATILYMGGQTNKDMDKGIVDTFGPYGLQKKLTSISESLNRLNTGVVTTYALYILVSLLFIMNVMYFSEQININYMLMLIFMLLIIFSELNNRIISVSNRNSSLFNRLGYIIINAYQYIRYMVNRIICFYQYYFEVFMLIYVVWLLFLTIYLTNWTYIIGVIDESVKLAIEIAREGDTLFMEGGELSGTNLDKGKDREGDTLFMEGGESSGTNLDKGKGRDEYAPPRGGWPTPEATRPLPSDLVPNITGTNKGTIDLPICIEDEPTSPYKDKGTVNSPICIEDEPTSPGKGPIAQEPIVPGTLSNSDAGISSGVGGTVASTSGNMGISSGSGTAGSSSGISREVTGTAGSSSGVSKEVSGTIASSSGISSASASGLGILSGINPGVWGGSGTVGSSNSNVGVSSAAQGTVPSSDDTMKVPEGTAREAWTHQDHPLTTRPRPDLPLIVNQELPFSINRPYGDIYEHFHISDPVARDARIIETIQANNFAMSDYLMERFWYHMRGTWDMGRGVQGSIDARKLMGEAFYKRSVLNHHYSAREAAYNTLVSNDMMNETRALENLHGQFNRIHSELGVIYYHQAKYDNDLNIRTDINFLKNSASWRVLNAQEKAQVELYDKQQSNLAAEIKKDRNFIKKVFQGHSGDKYIDTALKRKINDDFREAAKRPRKNFD